MAELINPNDPRAKRTRKFLQQAFLDLLNQKDFENISVQDIADRAEMNRTTFYSHFQDKYELLDMTLSMIFSEILTKWFPGNKEFDENTLIRNLILALCEWHTELGERISRKSSLSPYIDGSTKNQLYNVILSCLQQLSDDAQNERRLEIISIMLSSSICDLVLHWKRSRTSETPEELITHVLPYIIPVLHAINLDVE